MLTDPLTQTPDAGYQFSQPGEQVKKTRICECIEKLGDPRHEGDRRQMGPKRAFSSEAKPPHN